MRKSLIFLIAAGAGAATFAAGAGVSQDRPSRAEADYRKLVAGKTPGKPVSCIDTRFTRPSLSAYGDKLIYRVNSNLVYVSETNGGCSNVARGDALVTQRFQTRQCRGDIATTVDTVSRFPTGGCALGPFTPYRTR